jgi:hypothetical protein
LFIEVAQRYNGHNNGEIGLGVREAGARLHIRPQTAGLAFSMLIERGFLKVARDSAFNVKSRLSREWTVTMFPRGDDRATFDFMRWRPAPEIREQCRRGPLSVLIEDTAGNKPTLDSDEWSHRRVKTGPDYGGLNRITSISHQGGSYGTQDGAGLVTSPSAVACGSNNWEGVGGASVRVMRDVRQMISGKSDGRHR